MTEHYQKVHLEIMLTDNSIIPIDFDICAGDFRVNSERYYLFEGTKGNCVIDLARNVIIEYDTNYSQKNMITISCDNGDGHGGGDYFVMDTFINLMLNHTNDNIVSLQEALRATHIGCLAERSLENGGSVEMYYNK